MKKIIVIGSGFSSLSAACYLAKAGYDVTVLEKNGAPGGRASQYKKQGFTFDMGPSWYWMPDIFERFFADFGKKPADYYNLKLLDPGYRVYFSQNNFLDIPASPEKQYELFEQLEKGSGKKLQTFLAHAGRSYHTAMDELVYKPGRSPFELISTETILNSNLFMQSIRALIRKKFKHPSLVKILEFPVLFLGASPHKTPAFYHFMNYADLKLGTWYPEKGMYSVIDAMVNLATSLGVKIQTSVNVEKIETQDTIVKGVTTTNGFYNADIVVSGADYHHTETLIDKSNRNYSAEFWDKKTFAPSALMFFCGINKKLVNIHHHTLFFDEDFEKHAEEIYDYPSWPEKPLFYASFPSFTDNSVAPEGNETMTLLIPIAAGLTDNEELREIYFRKVIGRLETITSQKIMEYVLFKKSYCINDFMSDYNSYKGNAYGLANTLKQTAFLRPAIRSKKLKNLFFTGQLTVPGPGVPPALISGKIAAADVIKRYPVTQYAESTL